MDKNRSSNSNRKSSNTDYDNRGFHGEPAEQRITSRHGYHGPIQGEFRKNGNHAGRQTSIEMQPMGQQYSPVPANVQYVIPMQGYLPPGNVQSIHYAHPVNGVLVFPPGNQNMVRDTSSPFLDDDTREPYSPSMAGIIFKRVISALFMLLDMCLSWLQFASWAGHFDLPDWLSIFETVGSLKSK